MPTRVARNWRVRDGFPVQTEALVEELGISPRLADLLVKRGVDEPEGARSFLSPGADDLHDPFLLADMNPACERVHRAGARDELVTLYGDYDVDGTVSMAILYWVLKKLGVRSRFQIPDRFDGGYGFTEKGLAEVKAAGSTLVITVDQGVVAHAEVDAAMEMGIDVVITDHHTPGVTLPDAVAVVHPARPGQDYPNPWLCGAGVAFKLGQALLRTAEQEALRESAGRFVENCLDLVALATVADVCPLRGENRSLVALGLEQMRRTRHPGLLAMLRVANRDPERVSAEDLGFGVAPLMNAAGRLQSAELALDCLLARNPRKAQRLASELSRLNVTRRELTEDLVSAAVEDFRGHAEERIGVLSLDTDAIGILGLVAGRLKEAYWRPFVVCGRRGEELVGSCRSIEGYDIKRALDAVDEHLLKHGGHPQAAGLSLSPERFPALQEALRAHAALHLPDERLTPQLPVDQELSLEELEFDLLADVEPLGPFGNGNPAPVFMVRGCEVEGVRVMGKTGHHVRLRGKGFPQHLDPVGFHLRAAVDRTLEQGRSVDLAFQVGRDEWRGRTRLQMRLEDLRTCS